MFTFKRYYILVFRFLKRIRSYGVMSVLQYSYSEYYFDKKRGIKTRKISFLPELLLDENSHCYVSTTEKTFKNIVKNVPKYFFNKNFLDVGCGRGKVLILAKENGFNADIIGIELSNKLAENAKNNLAKCCINAKIQNINALDYKINKNDDVFFFYNPFTELIFNQVLDNIVNSVKNLPRKILVIYVNPMFENCLKKEFSLLSDFEADLGQRVVIYEL